jgi:hypothetical protein
MALNVSSTGVLTSATSAGGLQTSTTVLSANEARTSFMIQNQDTNPLYLCFGGTASSSVFHVILKACSSAKDGTGGTYTDQAGIIWNGLITCYSSGTPSYTVMETADK